MTTANRMVVTVIGMKAALLDLANICRFVFSLSSTESEANPNNNLMMRRAVLSMSMASYFSDISVTRRIVVASAPSIIKINIYGIPSVITAIGTIFCHNHYNMTISEISSHLHGRVVHRYMMRAITS